MADIETKTQEESSDDKEVISETVVTVNVSSKSENTTIKEESTVAKQEVKTQEPTYTIQEYMENSKALGYSKEVVAGALFNCEKSELTRTEFEARIKNFLGKKVE